MSEKELQELRRQFRYYLDYAEKYFCRCPMEFKGILKPYVDRMIKVEGMSAPHAWVEAATCQLEQWSEQRDS